MEIHILQRQVAALSSIAEINMLEIDISARHFRNRVFCIFHLRNFIQHFRDTVCGCLGDHDLHKHKCNHHQGHQDLKRIHDDTGEFSGLHRSADDALSSDQHHDDHHCIHRKLHDRGVPRHKPLSFRKELEHQSRDLSEFLHLMVFTHIRLDHARCIDILLNSIVEHIVLIKHLDKMGVRFLRNKKQHSSEDRNRDQQTDCDLYIDRQRHNK